MQDAPDCVHKQLRSEDGRCTRVVVVRCDLDEIQADDLAAFRQPGDKLKSFVVEEAAMRRCACSRRDRGIETINVDRYVVALPGWNAIQNRINAQLAKLTYREDVRTHAARIVVALACR